MDCPLVSFLVAPVEQSPFRAQKSNLKWQTRKESGRFHYNEICLYWLPLNLSDSHNEWQKTNKPHCPSFSPPTFECIYLDMLANLDNRCTIKQDVL